MDRVEKLVVPKLLEQRAAELGSAPYFNYNGATYSYAETHHIAQRIAESVRQLGIQKGARVGLMSQNCPEMVLSWLGLGLAGVIIVPINPAMKGEFLRNIIVSTGMEAIIVQDSALSNLIELGDDLGEIKRIAIIGEGYDQWREDRRYGTVTYEDLVAGKPRRNSSDSEFFEPLQILPTSGTTGVSKGVLMPHSHLCHLALTWIYAVGLTQSDHIFMPMQMYHVNANYAMVAALLTGCSVQLEEKFSASRFWQGCRESGATVAHASVSLYNIFMQQLPSPEDRNHKVRAFWQTGTDRAFDRRFGVGAAAGYGQTEIGLPVIGRYDDADRPEKSAGRPYDRFYEVQVVDDVDNLVPPGTVGEVVMRPRQPYAMMLGYYGNPGATVTAWRNLWHHTGDLAHFDEQGYLFFKSRKKDVIRRRGENISALDVERVLQSHSDVAECAVVAYPAAVSEDEVRAVVVVRPGAQIDPAQLCAYCMERMPAFMVPRYFEFRDTLPRTFHNRIEKYRLQEEGLGSRVWDRENP